MVVTAVDSVAVEMAVLMRQHTSHVPPAAWALLSGMAEIFMSHHPTSPF